MNVGEFKQLLEDRNVPDDHRLTIQFRGGLAGSTVDTKSAYLGFDWTSRQLVISPETELVIDEWYRILKKGAGHDASHIGRVLKVAEKVVEEGSMSPERRDEAIENLRVALERLASFQKQGF